MGKIISEKAENIYRPISSGMMVDDIQQLVVIKTSLGHFWMRFRDEKINDFIKVWFNGTT